MAPDSARVSRDASGHTRAAMGGVAVFLLVLLWTGLTPERWVDIDAAKSSSWNWRLSVAAADTSIVLLAITLGIGPLRVLRGKRARTHIPLRRAFGLWAGGFALMHVAFAVFVHAAPTQLLSNWITTNPIGVVRSYRGVANWLGLLQVTLVLLLLWLSRDSVLRRFGPPRWKRLQRSAYLLGALVAVHAFIYQIVEQRILVHSMVLAMVIAGAGALQLAGIWVVRRERPNPQEARNPSNGRSS